MSSRHDLYSSEWSSVDSVVPSSVNPEHLIQQAIINLANDAGAVLEIEVINAFKQLYQENPASYNRFRQQVKDSK